VQSMQDSAKEQSLMVEKTTILTEHIHQYTEQIVDHQSMLENTVRQLNETAEKNIQLQSATSDLLENMIKEREVFNDYFETHMNQLKENVDSIISQTSMQLTLQERFEGNLQEINLVTISQETLSTSLTKHAELSLDSNQQLERIVHDFSQNADAFVLMQVEMRNLLSVTTQERERVDGIMNDVYESLKGQLDKMDDRVESIKFIWESTSDSMSKANKQLSVSMNQFTSDMHRGLEHTFVQFDQELSKSVQYLSNGVHALQEGIIELPDALVTLKQTVNELNKQASRMVNPN
jgi:hypothetical protein